MKYIKLKQYKYQLAEDYKIVVGVKVEQDIFEPNEHKPYISLDTTGVLTIYAGYCWDGPSGPTVDTINFMRGSLVHDALYQLMRQGKISTDYRQYADRLLYEHCLEDGMSKARASYVYRSVHLFGASSAAPSNRGEMQNDILEAP